MNKKQIIILIIAFIFVLITSTVLMYFVLNKDKSVEKTIDKESKNVLKIGDYTLKYGKYKGIENEYNFDEQKLEKKEVILTFTNTKINSEVYEVKETSLYVNGYEMYKVTGDNKIRLLAGEGVDFEYEGK